MTSQPRITHKLFAGTSNNTGVFGGAKAGFKITTQDIAEMSSLPAWLEGLQGATIVTPEGNRIIIQEEMEAFLRHESAFIDQITIEGILSYDIGTTYNKGSLAKSTDGTINLYTSLADNNKGNPLDDTNNWLKKANNIITNTIKLTNEEASSDNPYNYEPGDDVISIDIILIGPGGTGPVSSGGSPEYATAFGYKWKEPFVGFAVAMGGNGGMNTTNPGKGGVSAIEMSTFIGQLPSDIDIPMIIHDLDGNDGKTVGNLPGSYGGYTPLNYGLGNYRLNVGTTSLGPGYGGGGANQAGNLVGGGSGALIALKIYNPKKLLPLWKVTVGKVEPFSGERVYIGNPGVAFIHETKVI